ncbi:hypothetical protein Pmani_011342 [Petrolisthes manimaculis]|uniref:Uncharacterized protein n=1 Tax=Petrolisthes manimaculis TaxID=1843537 RepID=A0AAE1UB77_9EUCA|nr:hypothetical protein Pmani_011342 [Petrolisthes manimaculis]
MLNLLLYACPMLLLSTTTFTPGFSTRLGQTYTQDQRYQAIIHALPHEVFSSLSPIISTFNQATVYEELISAHGMSTQQYLKALKDVQLDGPQHSELLQHMQQLNEKVAMAFNDDVLKSRHSKLLPTEIQLHLQAQPTLPLHEYGKLADALMITYTDGVHTHSAVPTPLPPAQQQPALPPPQSTLPPPQQPQLLPTH